jgi:dephospho-CoA kinase
MGRGNPLHVSNMCRSDAIATVGGPARPYALGMRVGLTGGVASGKSTVSGMLADLGAVVVDADRLARDVVAPGTPGLAAVVAEFGSGVLTADGALDRPAMGAIVFADPARRAALEAIIHPLVRQRAAELEASAPAGALVVHDIPLLTETGQAASFDAVLVVDVPAELQVERTVRERGWAAAEAESRIAAQATREDRLAVATYVIDNTGTIEDLRQRVTEVFGRLVG